MAVTISVTDKDQGWRRIEKDIKALRGFSVEVGIMGNDSVEGVSVIDYATYNEFGTSRIPARPFMARTYEENAVDTLKYLEFMAGQMIDGKMNAMGVLNDLGNYYEAKIKQTIVAAKSWAVPNAASTVAMKGSSSPLIDTGRMLGAVKYEIRGV